MTIVNILTFYRRLFAAAFLFGAARLFGAALFAAAFLFGAALFLAAAFLFGAAFLTTVFLTDLRLEAAFRFVAINNSAFSSFFYG